MSLKPVSASSCTVIASKPCDLDIFGARLAQYDYHAKQKCFDGVEILYGWCSLTIPGVALSIKLCVFS
jgi:hypothetical protein